MSKAGGRVISSSVHRVLPVSGSEEGVRRSLHTPLSEAFLDTWGLAVVLQAVRAIKTALVPQDDCRWVKGLPRLKGGRGGSGAVSFSSHSTLIRRASLRRTG